MAIDTFSVGDFSKTIMSAPEEATSVQEAIATCRTMHRIKTIVVLNER